MSRSRKIILSLLTVLTVLASSVMSGDAGRESQFNIGSTVRGVGMGGAISGLADDASAVFWNQAAMSILENQEINLMHVTLFEGSIFDAATFVYPNPRLGSFGFSFMRLGTEDILRRQDWNEMGQFSYSTWQFMLAYGRQVAHGYNVGGALKIVNQSLDNNSSYGVGVDLSFYKNIYKNISAGILFQDLMAPSLRLDDQSEVVPTTILAGIGIKDFALGQGFRHRAGIDLEKTEGRSVKLHLGIESEYHDYLSLRAGYDRDNLTFGIGVNYQKVRFDYAYKFLSDLTDSHRLGLSIQIGTPVSEKLKQEKELENTRGSSLILEDRRRQFRFFKDLGDKYYRNNSIDSAYAYYQRALAFNGEDRELKGRISQIDNSRQLLMEKARREAAGTSTVQPLLDGYYSQAQLFYSKGSYAAALDIVNVALGISPGNQKFSALKNTIFESRDAEIRKMMDEAIRAEREGRYTDAITAYNRIMELSPENTAIKQLITKTGTELHNFQLISQGAEFFSMGNLSDSRRRFEEVLRTDPENMVAKEYLDKISLLMKEATELEDLQKDEKVWKIYLNALEHFRNGDYENAIKLWEEVLKFYPGNKNTINNIDQAKLRLQSREKH